MIRIERRWWQWSLLAVGGALVGLLLLLSTATVEWAGGQRERGAVRAQSAILQRYEAPDGPFSLLYPEAWQVEPQGDVLWIASSGASSDARFVIEQGTLEPLPALLEGQQPERMAANVPVGGISGQERIYTLDPSPGRELGSDLLGGMTRAPGPLTVVLWEGPQPTPRYRVTLVDGSGGTQLPLLERMRDSLRWTE